MLSHFLRSASRTPLYISSSVLNNQSGSGSRTMTAPAGIQNGDLLLVFGRVTAGPIGMTLPTGWNYLVTPATGVTGFVAYKYANNESGNYTFVWSGSPNAIAMGMGVWRYVSGITTGTWVRRLSTDTPPASLTVVAASMTTTSKGLLLAFYGINNIRVAPTSINGVYTNSMSRMFTTDGVNASSMACFQEIIYKGVTGDRTCVWINNTANTLHTNESVLINIY